MRMNKEDAAVGHSNLPCSKWDVEHFDSLLTLGKGNYATVYLVESSQTRQLYAMKVRSKRFLYTSSEIVSMSTEKTVLLLAKKKHPFVVEVFGGFQTQSHIMLYLEFCQGGDLMHHLNTGGQFDIERARQFSLFV
jgi:serine/threonine protein kinase